MTPKAAGNKTLKILKTLIVEKKAESKR